MSYEIGYNDASLAGSTDVRAVIFEDHTMANVSNGTAFVPFVLGDLEDYMLTMSDRTGRGHFRLTVPAHINATGVRPIEFMESSGSHLGNFELQWSGTNLITMPSLRADVQQVSTVILADLDQIHIHAEDTATRVLLALPAFGVGLEGGLPKVGAVNGQIPLAYHSEDDGLPTIGISTGQILLSGGANAGGVVLSDIVPSSGADTFFDAIKAKTDTIVSIYHAINTFNRDQDSEQDKHAFQWFKDGIAITSGITSPTFGVKNLDNVDVIPAGTALTQVGSTGVYKYTATDSDERLIKGEPGVATITATIDGGSRTFSFIIGRDST